VVSVVDHVASIAVPGVETGCIVGPASKGAVVAVFARAGVRTIGDWMRNGHAERDALWEDCYDWANSFPRLCLTRLSRDVGNCVWAAADGA
jgi:hypothetical protein